MAELYISYYILLHCFKKWTCFFSSILSLKWQKTNVSPHCSFFLRPESTGKSVGERVGIAVLLFIEAKNRVINCSRKKTSWYFSLLFIFLGSVDNWKCFFFWFNLQSAYELSVGCSIFFHCEKVMFTFIWYFTTHALLF